MIMRRLILSLLALACAVPASAQLRPVAATTLRTTDTSANSLVVGAATGGTTGTGGIKAGQISVNGVGIIGTDGRIPAISSTYFASTAIAESLITDGSILARVASAETISGQYTFTAARGLEVNNTAPFLWFNETGATANETRYRMGNNADVFTFETINDAENATGTIFSVARTGTTVDTFTLGATKTIFPAGSAASPSIALTEAVGTANDSGLNWATGLGGGASLNIAVHGANIASFNASQVDFGVQVAVTGALGATPASLVVYGANAIPLEVDRTTSDGTLISLQQGDVEEGTISVSGTTVAYNTFMGAHYTQLMPGQQAPEQGMVVVSTGQQIPVKPRTLTKQFVSVAPGEAVWVNDDVPADGADRFVYVETSSRRNQKAVYGVWFASLNRTAAGMSWGDPDAEVFQVAGLGLSPGVWVTDTCGPIQNGDWLATSPIAGLAERQCAVVGNGKPGYDPVARDYTLGKALVDVDWSKVAPDEDGVRKVKIPATLKAS